MSNILSDSRNFLGELRRLVSHPIVSGVGVLSASQYLAAGVSLITAVVAARLLGSANYGTAALIMAYPAFIWSLANIKSASVTTRYITAFRANGQSEELVSICKWGYSLDFLMSVLALLFVAATGWWIARFVYNIPEIFWLMSAYAASFPLLSLGGTSWAVLSSWQRFRLLALFQVIESATTFLLVASFLYLGFGVAGMVVATAVGQAVIGIAMLIGATYELYGDGHGLWWKGSLKSVASLRKELTSFLSWNFFLVTFSGLLEHVPLMLLGRLRGPAEAGFYRLAMSFVTVGSYLGGSFGRVSYPALAALWSTSERSTIYLMLKRWTSKGVVPLGILILAAIPFLRVAIPFLLGHTYTPLIVPAQIMMVGAALAAALFLLNSVYYASGKIGLWAKANGIHTAVVIGLAWFCIQSWGLVGLAVLVTLAKALFTVSMAIAFFRSSIATR